MGSFSLNLKKFQGITREDEYLRVKRGFRLWNRYGGSVGKLPVGEAVANRNFIVVRVAGQKAF